MGKLEKAQFTLSAMERAASSESLLNEISPGAKLVVTLLYIVALISFPLHATAGLILFALYPIVASAMSNTAYERIFVQSLMVLPFVALIGLFNPLLHCEIAFRIGSIGVSYGWLEFASIVLRGVLSVQAVLVLVYSTRFHNLCRSMVRMGIPSLFATQLMFVYRYMFVLVDEAVSMDRARRARSYGRCHYSLRMYGIFVGQLLLRTVNRATRIHKAMLSRGFDGSIPATAEPVHITRRDYMFVIVWILLFVAGRFFNVSALFNF